ncbi:hypothetical protein TRAPUB_1708 [Trametes pubescens]|uniref:Uncharacterized protein n=1 Tax=Trametes pubescens TaxID=154538 RepID=A0A1M2VIL9_TRAPU|nr:hypothetical protein TRAPUB_1708 [Trametes pubescens]
MPIPLQALHDVLGTHPLSPTLDRSPTAIHPPHEQSCIGEPDFTSSPLLKKYPGELVWLMPNSIGPICAIYPSQRTESGAIPVYIYIPRYMPSIKTPWIISTEPCAPIGVDASVVLPLIGTRSVHSLVYVDRMTCTFQLADPTPSTAGMLSPGPAVYIQVPRDWTYGVHEPSEVLEVPPHPTGVRHHIRKVKSWIDSLRKAVPAVPLGSEVSKLVPATWITTCPYCQLYTKDE